MMMQTAVGLFLDPGLGKTSICLSAFKLLKEKGYVTRALIIAPLRPMYSTWPAEIWKWTDFENLTYSIVHGSDKESRLWEDVDIHLINPDGLLWLLSHKTLPEWDVLIIDECFPAGTMVTTPAGEVPIETLKQGDSVCTSAGAYLVDCTGSSFKKCLSLTFSDRRVLRCTPDHRIFTDLGWKKAEETVGRIVYGLPEVRTLRNSSQTGVENVLQQILFHEDILGKRTRYATQGASTRNDDGPEEGSGNFLEQGGSLSRRNETDFSRTGSGRWKMLWRLIKGWKRNRNELYRTESQGSIAGRMGKRVIDFSTRKSERLSALLQSGFREHTLNESVRSGRPEPHAQEAFRREERRETRETRVVSVSNLEQDSVRVYNLRIKECPHFFAGGILVHNSTKFKDTNTQRFKLIKPLLAKFKRRWILTGTPVPNGLMDLFGQIYILDQGAALGRYITHFRNAFFFRSGFNMYDWKPMPDAFERIIDKISHFIIQLSAEDWIQMPELMKMTVSVELPPLARKSYDEVEENFLTNLTEGMIVAANAGAAGVKCRQIANGAVYTGEERKWAVVHDTKLDALEDLLEELNGHPVLLLYEFDHDRQRIMSRFPSCVDIKGGDIAKMVDRFNRGDIGVLLGHPASMGHGLNLQGACHHVIWFGITWNLEYYDQAIARVHRQGQKSEKVFVYHIIANNTLDERVVKILGAKSKTQQDLLTALGAGTM